MENLIDFIQSLVLLVPVIIMVLTEAAKRIEKIPVTSKNAKWFVAGLTAVAVIGWAWYQKSLDVNNVVALGSQFALIYASAIGFYETIKGFLKKA